MVALLAGPTWAADEATRKPRVLIIGDSISIGYTEPVRRLLDDRAEVVRIPENGSDSGHGLEKLTAWLGNGRWDVIHFNWGLHDLKYLKDGKNDVTGKQVSTLDEYVAHLDELVGRLKATGAKLIWASTTPIPEGTAGRIRGEEIKYNAAAREVMDKHGVVVDDLYAYVWPCVDQYQLPRNAHFSPKGYEFLAKQVARAIAAELADPKPPFEMAEVTPPAFAERTFDIREYGAAAGSEKPCTEAIAKAIKACSEAGGGARARSTRSVAHRGSSLEEQRRPAPGGRCGVAFPHRSEGLSAGRFRALGGIGVLQLFAADLRQRMHKHRPHRRRQARRPGAAMVAMGQGTGPRIANTQRHGSTQRAGGQACFRERGEHAPAAVLPADQLPKRTHRRRQLHQWALLDDPGGLLRERSRAANHGDQRGPEQRRMQSRFMPERDCGALYVRHGRRRRGHEIGAQRGRPAGESTDRERHRAALPDDARTRRSRDRQRHVGRGSQHLRTRLRFQRFVLRYPTQIIPSPRRSSRERLVRKASRWGISRDRRSPCTPITKRTSATKKV